jgi:hypothetical protein
MLEGWKQTDGYIPVRLVSDANVAVTGKVYTDITVGFGSEGDTSETSYSVAEADWKEQGNGNYWLNIGADEWTTCGVKQVRVACTGAASYVALVDVHRPCKKYIAVDGSDAHNGHSWDRAQLTAKTVIEAAAAYSVIVLGPGVHDIGANKLAIPDDVSLHGFGRGSTVLTSSYGNGGTGAEFATYTPGDMTEIADMSLLATANDGTHHTVVGWVATDGPHQGVTLRRLFVKGWDCAIGIGPNGPYPPDWGMSYSSAVGDVLYIEDSTFIGGVEGFNQYASDLLVQVTNGRFVSTQGSNVEGSTWDGPGEYAWGVASSESGSPVVINGGIIAAYNASVESMAVHTMTGGAAQSGGRIHLEGVTIHSTSTGAGSVSYDIRVEPYGDVLVAGTQFNDAKNSVSANGTLTLISPAMDSINVASISAGAIKATTFDNSTAYPLTATTISTAIADLPTNSEMATAIGGLATAMSVAAIADAIDDLPTNSELATAMTGLATTSQVTAVVIGLAGIGARSVTITVNDGTTVVEGATVRVTKGTETYALPTNVSGVTAFSLDDGTWSVAISHSGYTFTPTTLVVDGDETHTYSLSAVVVPASNPGFVTGYYYCYDEEGEPEEGAIVQCRVKDVLAYGESFDSKIRSRTSASDGLVTFKNMKPGGKYLVRRGEEGEWAELTVATTATTPYALLDVLGEEVI